MTEPPRADETMFGADWASDSTALPPSEYIVDREGERLDAFLARRIGSLSRTAARRLIVEGLVRVDGGLERPSFRLEEGGAVVVWPSAPAKLLAEAESIPLDVLYEDAWLIVLNKQAGLTVHPAPGQPDGTLVNALLAHCPDLGAIGDAIRPGLVHRLDKDTTGVMMVAKQEQALHHLQDQIKRRSVEKRYLCVTEGVPDPEVGAVEAPIGRDRSDPTRMAIVDGGKPARTEYRVVERFADAALVEARLITGRTHQIRVHMTALGHPIIGDVMYGTSSHVINRQALHAAVLGFRHPQDERPLRFEAALPADMESLVVATRARPPVFQEPAAGLVRSARLTRHRARHVR